jgi:hypothetical protein
LLDKLPSEFDDFKKKHSHYVCRIKDQVGRLRQEIWFGMANGLLYPNPRKGVQYQVGIDSNELIFNGIWIEGTYDARATRLEVTSRLNDKRSQFIRILRRLGAGFTLKIWDSKDPIQANNFSEADMDDLIYELPRHDTYVHIGKPIPKKEVIALGDRILDEILKTASELLPVYRLLTEGKVEPVTPRSRSIPSTQLISESSSWGMKIVKKYERSENRKPIDVSRRVEGYDILSKDEKGNERYIEVKSRRGGFRVSLTENEYDTARQKGDAYYLYIVRSDGSIRIIRNPLKSCKIKRVSIPEFEVCDWVQKGRLVSSDKNSTRAT